MKIFVDVVFNISVLATVYMSANYNTSSLSVWCTALAAIKKVYIKSKIMSADQLKSAVQLLFLHDKQLVSGLFLNLEGLTQYVCLYCGPSTKVFVTENRSFCNAWLFACNISIVPLLIHFQTNGENIPFLRIKLLTTPPP